MAREDCPRHTRSLADGAGRVGRLWVSVLDTKARDAFCVEVHKGERPLGIFHHPYAYANHRGIVTIALAANEADQTFTT